MSNTMLSAACLSMWHFVQNYRRSDCGTVYINIGECSEALVIRAWEDTLYCDPCPVTREDHVKKSLELLEQMLVFC